MAKAFKWITFAVIALVVLIVAAAILIPVLFKDDIEALVQEQINENLNAQVSWSDLDLSLISSFPSLTLQLENVVVANNAPFEGVELANIAQTNVELGLMSVLTDNIKVKEVGLQKPIIDIRVLEDGTANYDITLADSSAAEEAIDDTPSPTTALEKYWVKDGRFTYTDESANVKMDFNGLNHEGSGDLGADLFELSTETEIKELLFRFDGVNYLNRSHATLDADLAMDMSNMKFTFKENELVLDKLPLQFDGWFAMPENGYDMDLTWAAQKTNLEGILSLVPAEFAKDLEGVEMSGASGFDGFVKGHYDDQTMPAFGLHAKVKDGRFKYPDLPSACEQIQLTANIDNPQGADLDGMVVHIEEFTMNLAGQPLDAKLLLKNPISDPLIDAALKTKLDLAKIKEVVPMEDDDRLQGLIDADVVLKGALSAIENQDYDSFQASGNALLQGMQYVSRTTGFPVNINLMKIALDPRFVDMSEFKGKFGGSDLSASGRVDNYLGWYLKEEGLKGRFKVHSNLFDMDELMASNNDESTAFTEDSVEAGVFLVPENFDVQIDATASKVLYDGLELENASGRMAVKDENIGLEDVYFKMFGGSVKMNGDYNTKDEKHPFIDFDYDVNRLDIAQTARYVGTVQKMAPIAKSAIGRFSTKMNLRTELDENMEPIFESILGNGDLSTYSVSLDKFKPVTKMANTLNLEQLKDPKLSDTKFTFIFKDGRMVTQPFNVNISGMDAAVSGSSGLDQSIDYNIKTKVPASMLGGNVNGFVSNILGQANQTLGSDVNIGDMIDVEVLMTGTMEDPVIKPRIAGGTQNIKDQVVDQVKETITEEVQDLSNQALEEAQKQADKLMAEANKQADQIRKAANDAADKVKAEGYAAAQKLEAEAKNPFAKVAAKAAADKMRKETDKKAQNVRDEGDRKANGVVNTAQQKADKLLAEARQKAP